MPGKTAPAQEKRTSASDDNLSPLRPPRAGPWGTAMPFVAPSAARMPPLDFLLADQMVRGGLT